MLGDKELPDDIYVVLMPTDIDQNYKERHPDSEGDAIICETQIYSASKQSALAHASRSERRYGRCLIGRVIVSELDQINRPQSVADMLKHENSKLDALLSAIDECDCQDAKRYQVLEWIRNL